MHFAGSTDALGKLHRSSARKTRFRMTRLFEPFNAVERRQQTAQRMIERGKYTLA